MAATSGWREHRWWYHQADACNIEIVAVPANGLSTRMYVGQCRAAAGKAIHHVSHGCKCSLQTRWSSAQHYRKRDVRTQQNGTDAGVHRRARLRPIAHLAAIRLPGQVESAHKRQLATPVRLQRILVQAGIAKHLFAVNSCHQCRRVGKHDGMPASRSKYPARLLLGDMPLFARQRRTSCMFAEFTQVLRHQHRIVPFGHQGFSQSSRKCALACAFGAQQRNKQCSRHAEDQRFKWVDSPPITAPCKLLASAYAALHTPIVSSAAQRRCRSARGHRPGYRWTRFASRSGTNRHACGP